MFFAKEKAVQVNNGGQPIPITKLKRILKEGHASPDHWELQPHAKTLEHLHQKLISGRALLIPCDGRLLLVEEILILDVQIEMPSYATLHLFEQYRIDISDVTRPNVLNLDHFDGIAVSMNVNEDWLLAAHRCVKQKLQFDPVTDVSIKNNGIFELGSTVTKSVRYPGLHQVQQRCLAVAKLSSQKHSKAYSITRKNGKIISVFSWRCHEPIYNAVAS